MRNSSDFAWFIIRAGTSLKPELGVPGVDILAFLLPNTSLWHKLS